MFKTNNETILIDAKATDPINTGVVFWSHDRGTAKLIFQLQKDYMNQPLSAGTIVPILLEFNSDTAEGGRGRHIYNATIEDSLESIVSIVLEDNILGYQGRVDGSVYIELPDSRSLDTAGRFTFDIKRSPIDENVPELEDYYWQGFNEIVEESKRLINQVESDCKVVLDNLNSKVTVLETQTTDIKNKQAEIIKSIEEHDVFTKEESSANVIDTIGGATSTIFKDEMLVNGVEAVASRNNNGTLEPFSQADYDDLDNSDKYVRSETLLNGRGAAIDCEFPVIEILEKRHPWMFKNTSTLTEKIQTYLSYNPTFKIPFAARGRGILTSNNVESSRSMMYQKRKNGSWIGVASGTSTNITSNFVTYGNEGWGKTHFDEVLSDGNYTFRVCSKNNDITAAGCISDGVTPAWVELRDIKLIVEFEANGRTVVESIVAANHVENLATQEEAENGVSDLKTMTPKRTAEQTLARFGQSFTPSTKFIAHRGNNSFYPENSIAAFEKTSRHWGAETDIQLTTDGKWYCFHDRTLDRMTNGTGNFMDKTSSEIEALRLDTGNGINTLSDVEKKIPTFEQYLNACIKARIVPVIEITPLKTDFTDAQLDSIVTVIRRKGLLNKCVIICFTYEVLVKMRQRMPYTVMHWLISEYSEEMIQKCVINNFVPSFDYSKASVNQALIDKIHDTGLECGLWTVPYSDHQKYTDMGVDNITTDSASGNLRYFEPALRSGMLPNSVDLTGPTYIEETSNGEIHIRVNVTGGQNDVGVYICALESWAIPRHSLSLIGHVRTTKVTGFTFVPVSVGVGGYSANDSSIADANTKFGYLTTGTSWEQRSTYAAFDLFYRI